MHVQKQSNSRVLNIPFSCRNWMEAKDLCISLYFFSVIMTQFIDHMLIPLLRVLLHLLSVTVVIAAHRNMNKTKRRPWRCFLSREQSGNNLGTDPAAVTPAETGGGCTVLTVPASPGESAAMRQHLALPDTAVVNREMNTRNELEKTKL